MDKYGISFIYGACIMFYLMMAWTFWRKGSDRLSRLVMWQMLIVAAGCIKDMFVINDSSYTEESMWHIMTAVDMIAVPMYTFILTELCRPGSLTTKTIILHQSPFVLLPTLLILTGSVIFYYIEVVWAAIYGGFYAVWMFYAVPSYHKTLKKTFSYDENINLNWLRVIHGIFFVILGLWIVDCSIISLNIESMYLIGSLILWIFISYFIYKHESVIEELHPIEVEEVFIAEGSPDYSSDVHRLFVVEKLYLNPKLKLTDVARLVGTNRTYLSAYFNKTAGSTFYDYVNGLRLDHAEKLLVETNDTLVVIAEESGFNSLSTFRRSFEARHHCSPAQYRSHSGKI